VLPVFVVVLTPLLVATITSSSDRADEQATAITVIRPIKANVFITLFLIIFLFQCIKKPP
jgi:hypothetical protein